MADIEIKFGKDGEIGRVWDAEGQKQNITSRHDYTRSVSEADEKIAALDRFDDFSQLHIPVKRYEQAGDTFGYGIKYDRAKHGTGEVIRKKQASAAEQMLRDLRGFGLLADVVGSGKTYEAGVVLSELAERNRIKNMLIITPGQVLGDWVGVIEKQFGLGEGELVQIKEGDRDSDFPSALAKICTRQRGSSVIHPVKSLIVDVNVFAGWDITESVVFDVIVVDEAHHLCEEEGKYAKAMKLLSHLMEIKKNTGSQTYCLLLSATPHSGNLENMFRLWYFVRCKGGSPQDFDEVDDSARSKSYLDEKKYYLQIMCRGATNVTDFIRRVKLNTVTLNPYKSAFYQWLAAQDDFKRLPDGDKDPEKVFSALSEYARSNYVEDYLSSDPAVKERVIQVVAREYHALLRSIMIRQSAHGANRERFIQAKKLAKNVFFLPLPEEIYKQAAKLTLENGAKLDFTAVCAKNGFLPAVQYDGKKTGVAGYADAARGRTERAGDFYSRTLSDALGQIDSLYRAKFTAAPYYTKSGYVGYYSERFKETLSEDMFADERDDDPPWAQNCLVPVKAESGALGYKYEYLKQLLDENAGKRVIIFFDYELPRGERVAEKVEEALKKDGYSERLIVSAGESEQEKLIARFNGQKDAILFVKDPSLTEGANLQACNLIINYQVTPDPLAMDQRIGRVFRLGQDKDVTVYSFADMNKLEGFALAYFAGIGLLTSDSGDATILAGSNNDQMVTVRCSECGNVKLMSSQDYEQCKRDCPIICEHPTLDDGLRRSPELMEKISEKGDRVRLACPVCNAGREFDKDEYLRIRRKSVLICDHLGTRSETNKAMLMSEINMHEFKCDRCGYMLRRSVADTEEEGYKCAAVNEENTKGRMSSNGQSGNRNLSCLKSCAMSHCKRLKKLGCPVVKAEKAGNKSEAELMVLCEACGKCTAEYEVCRVTYDDVRECGECRYAGCSPKPTVIEFDDKWSAVCPNCGREQGGKLRPILPKTFAAYIRGLWSFQSENNSDESFCKNLGAEARKVGDIKKVLERDQ